MQKFFQQIRWFSLFCRCLMAILRLTKHLNSKQEKERLSRYSMFLSFKSIYLYSLICWSIYRSINFMCPWPPFPFDVTVCLQSLCSLVCLFKHKCEYVVSFCQNGFLHCMNTVSKCADTCTVYIDPPSVFFLFSLSIWLRFHSVNNNIYLCPLRLSKCPF